MDHVFDTNDRFASVKFDDGTGIAVRAVPVGDHCGPHRGYHCGYEAVVWIASGEVLDRKSHVAKTTGLHPDLREALAQTLWGYLNQAQMSRDGREGPNFDEDPLLLWCDRNYGGLREAHRDLLRQLRPWVTAGAFDVLYYELQAPGLSPLGTLYKMTDMSQAVDFSLQFGM